MMIWHFATRTFWLRLTGFLLLAAFSLPSFAALTLTSGANLQVSKGDVSDFISIRVSNDSGVVESGVQLGFELIGPNCESVGTAALDLIDNGVSNADGIVQLRLNAAASMIETGPHQLTVYRVDAVQQSVSTHLVVTQNNALFVTQGHCQTITANQSSSVITFQLLDSSGDPRPLIDVTFNIQKADGSTFDGLLALSGTTDGDGNVQTTVVSTLAGEFSVHATAQTALTYTASTPITVEAGQPGILVPISGDAQQITAGRLSESIVFELQDVFGNLATNRANQTVNFTVITPAGSTTTNGLTFLSATSNAAGEVSTSFTAPEILGEYEVRATLAGRSNVIGTATVIVQEALPGLPSLGFALMTDNTLTPLASITSATFSGGVSVNGGTFQQESVISSTASTVHFQGSVNVDPAHIGLAADLFVLLAYTPAPLDSGVSYLYMLTPEGLVEWDATQGVDTIQAFDPEVTLSAGMLYDVYSGAFPFLGLTQMLFGYRILATNTYVFNIEHLLTLLVQ